MSKLRHKSVRQLLQVLDLTRAAYRSGTPVRRACHDSIREISKKYGVEHQTIHDLCCRRLELERIVDFHIAVQKWLSGDPDILQTRVMDKANPDSHPEIRQYFGRSASQNESELLGTSSEGEEAMETFLVDLSRNDAKFLRILAEIAEKPPSKLIHDILTVNVKAQLKPIFEEALRESSGS